MHNEPPGSAAPMSMVPGNLAVYNLAVYNLAVYNHIYQPPPHCTTAASHVLTISMQLCMAQKMVTIRESQLTKGTSFCLLESVKFLLKAVVVFMKTPGK